MPEKIVRLATYSNPIDAEMVKNYLQNAGVTVFSAGAEADLKKEMGTKAAGALGATSSASWCLWELPTTVETPGRAAISSGARCA